MTLPAVTIEAPDYDEYAPFYRGYVEALPATDVLTVMEHQLRWIETLASIVDPARETFRYAPGKWSIRQVIGHLSDAERVFGYRAFCISRGDETPLPGFDENDYVESAASEKRDLESLAGELAALRRSNILLFRNLPPGSATNRGIANGAPVSVRALAFIIAGHAEHHLAVLEDRYGVSAP